MNTTAQSGVIILNPNNTYCKSKQQAGFANSRVTNQKKLEQVITKTQVCPSSVNSTF